jgi:NAD-dependent DNA ligase
MSVYSFIKEAKNAYYAGVPIISDSQYDYLIDIYGEQDVGTEEGDIPHFYRMYSLKKYYTDEDYPNGLAWYRSWKVDGAAISLLYDDGYLIRALTRGDGKKGKDITDKVMHIPSIPREIDSPVGTFQVNGEIAVPKAIPNARNIASGALGLKSLDEFKTRKELTFIAYSIFPNIHEEYSGDLMWLIKAGFEVVKPCSLIDKEGYAFPTDGIVYRLNNNNAYLNEGFTNHHPKGAFALKERSEGIKTTILDVIWQTGKTGKVTPVAILDPIKIDDAIVTRATLNNVSFIEALGVEIGDEVMVERAGGIIPRIICKAS